MVAISTYLPIWKEKLNKSKKEIERQLEEAKKNGGKTGEIRARLKTELKTAKALRKSIKEIEQEVGKVFECPCCQCKLEFNGDKIVAKVIETNKKDQ